MSDALKSNTTLTKLYMESVHTKETTHKWHPSTNHSFLFLVKSTENDIGVTGASSLSDALKSNTTLTQFNLESKHKKTTRK